MLIFTHSPLLPYSPFYVTLLGLHSNGRCPGRGASSDLVVLGVPVVDKNTVWSLWKASVEEFMQNTRLGYKAILFRPRTIFHLKNSSWCTPET